MNRLAIFLFASTFILAMSSNTWAACTQEPTEPSIFCVVPEVPVAGQIAQFELTELLTPASILWDFGDGNKISTLGNRHVEHVFDNPGRYSVKAWISHAGGFDSITQIVTVAQRDPVFIPTPITSFDLNRNRRIDNDEFFQALDLWIANSVRDLTFFKLMDAWISQSLIVEGSSLNQVSRTSLVTYLVYQLDGKLVTSLGCSNVSSMALQQKLLAKRLAGGIYVVLSRGCESGIINRSLVYIK